MAEQLNVALRGARPKQAEQTDAYFLVLQARHLLGEGERHNLPRVEALLNQAIQRDRDYVDALNELSRLHWQKRWNGLEPREESALLSRELQRRVLAIDPDNVVATLGLAWGTLEIEGDLAAAMRLVKRAIELDPLDTVMLQRSQTMMLRAGRTEDAIAIGVHVVRRDPLSIIPINNLGNAFLLAERFDDAEAQYKNALALHPASDDALAGLCKLELLRGNAQQAQVLAEQIHGRILRTPLLASALFDSGRPREADEALADLQSRWPELPAAAVFLAGARAWRGDSDNAFAWLAHALEARNEINLLLYDVLSDPMWKPQRSDSRWLAFLEQMGQSPEQLAACHFELRLPD